MTAPRNPSGSPARPPQPHRAGPGGAPKLPPPNRPDAHPGARPHVPDPTLVIVREPRSRGMVIAFGALFTLMAAIALLALLANDDGDATGDQVAQADPGAGAATQRGDTDTTPPPTAHTITVETIKDPPTTDTADPDSADPDSADPNSADPDGTDPDGIDPDSADPNGTDPDGTDPDGTDPLGTDPDGTDPDGTDPDGIDPDSADPSGTAQTATSRRITRRRPSPSFIELTFSPADAVVSVDGDRQRGGSPLRIGPLRAGRHSVSVTAPNHEPSERSINLRAGETERIKLRLTPSGPVMGKVDILSKPIGAAVRVDGRERGVTPLRGLELEAGKSYSVELTRDGYAPWRASMTPESDETKQIKAELVRVPEPAVAANTSDPTPAPPQRDITVSRRTVGKANRGERLFGRCLSCHGSSASALRTTKYTQSQWTRYLASRRHSQHAMLRPHFSVAELADVKAYLLENAADMNRNTAAGVR